MVDLTHGPPDPPRAAARRVGERGHRQLKSGFFPGTPLTLGPARWGVLWGSPGPVQRHIGSGSATCSWPGDLVRKMDLPSRPTEKTHPGRVPAVSGHSAGIPQLQRDSPEGRQLFPPTNFPPKRSTNGMKPPPNMLHVVFPMSPPAARPCLTLPQAASALSGPPA
ncbi:hypothetical protein PAPYR_11796 [Paratrimastix pyriformis]|uniref:Uncharacterized protein n=1 Tax=Paratrimastix pyriformis TaxID=342808 RepID=A0ABQ8U317_9EUKA|nr:hypothetical protein PAPYR_11796 [Paratrimastix pyriformis]